MAKATKANVTFKAWATTIARARGKIGADVVALREKFPEYKNDGMYAKKFPALYTRYTNYCVRGSQSKAA